IPKENGKPSIAKDIKLWKNEELSNFSLQDLQDRATREIGRIMPIITSVKDYSRVCPLYAAVLHDHCRESNKEISLIVLPFKKQNKRIANGERLMLNACRDLPGVFYHHLGHAPSACIENKFLNLHSNPLKVLSSPAEIVYSAIERIPLVVNR
ncbi:263_t:CDS:2, partial [Funneliformis mosseae]